MDSRTAKTSFSVSTRGALICEDGQMVYHVCRAGWCDIIYTLHGVDRTCSHTNEEFSWVSWVFGTGGTRRGNPWLVVNLPTLGIEGEDTPGSLNYGSRV